MFWLWSFCLWVNSAFVSPLPVEQCRWIRRKFPVGISSFSLIHTQIKLPAANRGLGFTNVRLALNHSSYLMGWAVEAPSPHLLPFPRCPSTGGFSYRSFLMAATHARQRFRASTSISHSLGFLALGNMFKCRDPWKSQCLGRWEEYGRKSADRHLHSALLGILMVQNKWELKRPGPSCAATRSEQVAPSLETEVTAPSGTPRLWLCDWLSSQCGLRGFITEHSCPRGVTSYPGQKCKWPPRGLFLAGPDKSVILATARTGPG